MKIKFKTNIDRYKTNCFPTNLTFVPRVGESVYVTKVFIEYFSTRGLPLKLKVVDVIYSEYGVLCELHYHEIDIKIAKMNNVNLY